MEIDMYFKLDTNGAFVEGEMEETSELELFIDQVDMILTTKPGSVLGEPTFGINLEKYLWTFQGGSAIIKQEIEQQISEFIINDYNIPYEIDVNFIKGEIFDSIFINFSVDGQQITGYYIKS